MLQKNIKNNDLLGQVIEKHGIPKQEEEIKTWNFRSGDYNDVYESKYLKGTYDQVEQYCKEYFKKRVWRFLEDIGSLESVGFAHYNRNGDTDLYTEANIIDYEVEENDIIDLTELEFIKEVDE